MDISDIHDLIQLASIIAAEISPQSYIDEGEAQTALQSVAEAIKAIKSLERTLDNFHEKLDDVVHPVLPLDDEDCFPNDF